MSEPALKEKEAPVLIEKQSVVSRIIRSDSAVLSLAVVLGGVMLWYAGSTGTIVVKLEEKLVAGIAGVFGSLLLVSLFVERVVEVIVFAWRDRQSEVHEQRIEYWDDIHRMCKNDINLLIIERKGPPLPDDDRKKRIDELIGQKREIIEDASKESDVEKKALLPFKAHIQKVSTWIGLTVGIFTSAVGFRFLSQIVVLDARFMETTQYKWFVAADVLLTGAVLAGGSKTVHEIYSVYESFTKSTKKSLTAISK